jgi:shikimate kinase
MNNIYLVGFMATGKSIIGKELARKLKRKFADLDELIELKEKLPIPEIFSKNGEPYFRKVEKEVLQQASAENNFIYACGGGIVMDRDNIKIMKQTGTVICLTAKPEIILKRVGDTSHRPLLNVPNPKEQVELLLKMRAPFYAQADKTIDTSGLSVAQVVAKISDLAGKKTK